MRATLLSSFAWFGALQFLNGPTGSLDTAARLAAIAGVLGTLTALVYQRGARSKGIENEIARLAAEVRKLREELTAWLYRIERQFETIRLQLENIERQLEAIAHLLAMLSDQLRRANRRQTLMDRRLARLEDDPSPYRDVLA